MSRMTEGHEPASLMHAFLAGGGEMGERMRALDWPATPLGAVDSWPQSLRSTLSMLLPSKAQIILFWGPEFVVFYNDAYRPVFGAKHPHALGLPGQQAWREIWDSMLHELLASVVQTGEAFWARDLLFELERFGFPEETYFDVSYDPVRVESGVVGGVFCIVTETTERVIGARRMALLRDLAGRNATARTASEACVLATQTLAASPHDITFALAYLDDELQSSTPEALERLAQAPPSLVQELSVASIGGRNGRLVVGLNPRRPFDEPYRAFIGLVADQFSTALTNAHAYEDERKRAEALAEIDRAKTAFFSNVSHEFRTPLTLLLGPVQDALLAGEPLGGDALATVHRSSLRLLKLVNTLLDFARIEAGRIDARYEPTDLAALTGDLASVFRSAVEKAGLEFAVECPPLPGLVYVDREMWEKIVFNLLSNAFKFTFDGRITVRLVWRGDHADLVVSDTGVGIAAADLPRIFERFHRVKRIRARTHEGTGIGLALVQELARLHGGTIAVDSQEGVGTTFTVSIRTGTAHLPTERVAAVHDPMTSTGATPYVEEALRWLPDADSSPAAAMPEALSAPPAVPAAARSRLLVADDNADMRDYLARVLGQQYVVDLVSDGSAALARARSAPPDLVLADVMMPRLDGLALLVALRADERTRTLPVILLSARAGQEARLEGLAAGADDYIVKPFSAHELLGTVGAQLQLSRLRREWESERVRLLEETAALTETLNNVGALVASDLDPEKVVQAVTDAATELTTAEFGAFFYNRVNEAGESYMLYTISGVPREAFSKFPMPRNTHVFEPTFKGTGVVRSDDITRDARYGQNAPYHGMPHGHLPVRSYLAVPVKGRSGQVIGGLFFGHSEVGRFAERHERLVVGIASWAAVALENAGLYASVQQASRLKDEFLASLSHELRTPLNAIVGYAHMLRTGMMPADRQGRAIQTIERNATSLTQIVDDVLDVSRIVAGKIRLNVQAVDPPDVVRRAIDVVTPAADAKGVRLESVLDPNAGPISGDPERLQQILWNLLSNAVKFTNRGGKVQVRLERINSHVEVTVSDTGIGIAPEFLPHVFERFRQGDPGSTRERGGLGLGLSIARQLVEMHGGTIDVSSGGRGLGATFRVKVPLAIMHPTPDAGARVHPRAGRTLTEIVTSDLGGVHVLAVDDERDALGLVTAVLEAAGARVSTAASAGEALALLDSDRPDVIVADLGMPMIDGYQFIDRVRRHRDRQIRELPAAALTAFARPEDRMRALRAGFHIHLAKPIDPAELVTTVAALARRFVARPEDRRQDSVE